MAKPKLVHVPTVPELAAEGLAAPIEHNAKGKPTIYRVKKKGQAKVNAALAHNAAVLKPLVDDMAAKRAIYEDARRKLKKAEDRGKPTPAE